MTVGTISELAADLAARLGEKLGIDARDIDLQAPFSRYGLDSVGASAFIAGLSARLGRTLSPTLTWQYPSVAALARYLVDGEPEAANTSTAPRSADAPIAVVGMSCRFPQASSTAAFWRLLRDGVDAVTEVPAQRWDVTGLYSPEPTARGKMNTKWGGFLEQVDQFDAQFFSIAPREAIQVDPQQRLMLELSWEALEDAGIAPQTLRDSPTGVFFGAMWQDYDNVPAARLAAIRQHTATGQNASIIPARVSYALGLRGPSIAFNTACSSSLVAVHYARRSLQLAECSLALAGGVNLLLAPENMVAMAKLGALAPDGRSKAFDSRADGYARGEGGGVVVLKPLPQAIASGDPIHCIILGSAVNNNGAGNGLTAPSQPAQQSLLRSAYADAGVGPHAVQYVETHGAGTSLGDPMEADALGMVLGKGRAATEPLLIGSVKTNIGHLEAAAGMAGLIKVVLALQHRAIPPNLHFHKANPLIQFDALHLQVPTTLVPWPKTSGSSIAGVSSFGFGGTNSHIVVAGADRQAAFLLPLAAPSEGELRALATKVKEASEAAAENLLLEELPALLDAFCQGAQRLALLVRTPLDLQKGLAAFLSGAPPLGGTTSVATPSRRGPVLVFAGQGAQWLQMGLTLMQLPTFRAAMVRCDQALQPYLGSSLLLELLAKNGTWLEDTARIQPAIFMIQVALAQLVCQLGIEPAAVVGQCLGEIAAAHIAGCLSLDDAARIICVRSRILRRLGGKGAMVATSLSPAAAQHLIAGREQTVAAAFTSPTSTVLTGYTAPIGDIVAELEGRGEFVQRIKIDYASHSQQIQPLLPELRLALQGIKPQSGSIPFYSTVTGQRLDGAALDATYWGRNEREPFRLADTLGLLIQEGHDVFLDVGPHPVLSSAVERCLGYAGQKGVALPLMRRGEGDTAALLETLGKLWTRGQPVHWPLLFPAAPPPLAVAEQLMALGLVSPQRPALEPAGEKLLLLPLSAHSPEALQERARSMSDFLEESGTVSAADIVYTASVRRGHQRYRLSVAGKSKKEWREQLQAFGLGKAKAGTQTGSAPLNQKRKVVFVFPGQGGQWMGMGRELLKEEAFRNKIEECDREMRKYSDWSLVKVLKGEGREAEHERVDVIQPAVFAMQVGLSALYRQWGVEPDAVVGHSLGEVAAAQVGGWLSIQEGCRVICLRSQLVRATSGQGAMAMVELPEAAARAAIKGYGERLSIGAINGPRTTVVSGDRSAVTEVLEELEEAGVYCRLVKVDYASHSPHMDALLGELARGLHGVQGHEGLVPLYSTVTGQRYHGKLGAEYWGRNLREPVQFHAAIQALAAAGLDTFVELNPHPILLPAIEEGLRETSLHLTTVATLRRDRGSAAELLTSLGKLFVQGHDLDWSSLHSQSGRVVALPNYPWQRTRYWLEESAPNFPTPGAPGGQLLLGPPLQLSTDPRVRIFEQKLDLAQLPYLADHRVRESVVLPGTAYLEMARAAAEVVFNHPPELLEAVALPEMMLLSPAEPTTVQVVVREEGPGRLHFEVASRDDASGTWRRHCSGWLGRDGAGTGPGEPRGALLVIRARCPERLTARRFYADLAEQGLVYGPAFQCVVEIFAGSAEALGEVRLGTAEAAAFGLHPVLLDGCVQVMMAALGPGAAPGPRVPVAVAAVRMHRPLGERVWSHVQLRDADELPGRRVKGDVRVLDESGEVLVELVGIELQNLKGAAPSQAARYLQLAFGPAELGELPESASTPRILLLADATSFADALRVRLQVHGATVAVQQVKDPAAMQQQLRDSAYTAVVYLGSLDGPPGAKTSLATLELAQDRHCGGVLAVVQALAHLSLRDPPRLWLVTRGVHAVGADPGPLAPAGGLLWGLGRTIAYEHPELSCTRLDLAGVPWPGELEALGRELLFGDQEEEVALRESGRFVARLVWTDPAPASPAVATTTLLHHEATYLITGGLGSLGLAVAKWLSEQGARHLVLVGRHGAASAAQQAQVAALERLGVEVVVARADVAQRDELQSVLEKLGERMPALRGVVHAAGVLEDALITQQDGKRLAKVMAPKVLGAWNLHELTQTQELDFFVLYSSVTALMGSPGQANYAAANSFLDALAHYRRSVGLPALSINWGPFADVGLAVAQENRGSRLAGRGMSGLQSAAGTAELGRLLLSTHSQVGVVELKLRQWVEFYPQVAASPFLAELLQQERRETRQAAQKGAGEPALQESLRRAAPQERRELLEKYLREQLGQVLRLSAAQIDRAAPFKSLGVDSLMGMELRNRLESGLGLKLSAALIWTYPDIGRLATHLGELFIDRSAEPREPPGAPPAQSPSRGANLDQLSDSELARLGDELLD